MKKIFPLWLEETKIKKIKQEAKKDNRSANSYILKKIEETPNLATGDWWDNPDVIRKIAREIKNKK